jgi:hypothetical protein
MAARLLAGLLITVIVLAVAAYAGRHDQGRGRRRLRPAQAAQTDTGRVGARVHILRIHCPAATIIEAYGALFQRDFAIPGIGRAAGWD